MCSQGFVDSTPNRWRVPGADPLEVSLSPLHLHLPRLPLRRIRIFPVVLKESLLGRLHYFSCMAVGCIAKTAEGLFDQLRLQHASCGYPSREEAFPQFAGEFTGQGGEEFGSACKARRAVPVGESPANGRLRKDLGPRNKARGQVQ